MKLKSVVTSFIDINGRVNIFVLQQQQHLGRRIGTCKMHISPPPPSGFGYCAF